jgi:sarcosine oxidase subunit beta
MKNRYDVIVIGAGSVGVPTAMALGEKGVSTLVIDKNASPGQGENKHALGGIRANHSIPGKILISHRSLEIFSTWELETGENIDWLKGGYLFLAYRKEEENILKGLLPIQKKFGLNIDYVSPDETEDILPGIRKEELLGGTFSPDDGSASPLLAINSFYNKAKARGVEFHFGEQVKTITTGKGKVTGVMSDKASYLSPIVIDAAGPYSKKLCQHLGIDIPVFPELHEAGITEPIESFFSCLVVDLRPGPGSKNYYFYQNKRGQVMFSIAPDPPIIGTDKGATSFFLTQVCSRMVAAVPRLKNIRIRRTWRGIYPMSPDGSPIVGWDREIKGLIHATAMCGQGFLLGPGTGELLARMVTRETTGNDKIILEEFSPFREFESHEALK